MVRARLIHWLDFADLDREEGGYYYFNRDGSSYYRTPVEDAIYVTPQKETYYTPSNSSKKTGIYCIGVNWQTRNVINCWKDQTTHLMVRTARRNILPDEILPTVKFLTYKADEDDEIMYEVDERGLYVGIDKGVIEDLRDLPPPERRVFQPMPTPTRRKLFTVAEGSFPAASPLQFADVIVKIEEKDDGKSLTGVDESPIVEIKLEGST